MPKWFSPKKKKTPNSYMHLISYPYPDLRKNDKKKNLMVVVLSMSISQFLWAPLGYQCRFEWYNSGNGMDGGGYELCLLLISVSQVFFFSLLYLCIASVSVKSIHKRRNWSLEWVWLLIGNTSFAFVFL